MVPTVAKGAEKLRLMFIVGVEPHVQILTLAAYVASWFTSKAIHMTVQVQGITPELMTPQILEVSLC